MFRVLVTTACLLFLILVAIVIASSLASETPISTANKLESNLNRNLKGNDTVVSQLKAENITSEQNETIDIVSERNATTFNADSVNVASDNISKKEVKVSQASTYGGGTGNNISAVINSKQELIKQLQIDIEKAEKDLQGKIKRLKEVEQRALTTRKLSLETQKQFDMLITTMNVLQNSILQTSKAANEAFWQAQLQTAKYNDAKRRHSKLVAELGESKSDYNKMKIAVEQAMRAAKIAMSNIQDSSHAI